MMSVEMRAVLAALAVYRLARMLGKERGPFDMLLRLRNAVYMRVQLRYGEQGGDGLHWLYDGVTCPLCISLYLGFLGAWWLGVAGSDAIVAALALSGAASLAYKLEHA